LPDDARARACPFTDASFVDIGSLSGKCIQQFRKEVRNMVTTKRNVFVVGLVIMAGCIVGCASQGVVPAEKLANAETAIRLAQTAEVKTYAPLELRIAEDRLTKARAAVVREDYDSARRLADEALVNAQLAEKKAESEKAKRAAQEMRSVIESLRSTAQETLQ
jgi:hypothetical protein